MLDRKNITLRKILSSIPQNKLEEILQIKYCKFNQLLLNKSSKISSVSKLNKQITPKMNNFTRLKPSRSL